MPETTKHAHPIHGNYVLVYSIFHSEIYVTQICNENFGYRAIEDVINIEFKMYINVTQR